MSQKELAALRLLLGNPGHIVTAQDLKQAFGGDAPALDESVSKHMASLRKKLEPEECIETVYRRGYRFSAAVTALHEPAETPPRLAILPFAVEYGVPEHLGAAIAEDTGAWIENWQMSIARPAPLSVVSPESVFTLAQRGVEPRQIARILKADLILQGSLRALASHYRLRAEMIHAADGSQAWFEDLLVDRSRIGGLETELVNRLKLRMKVGEPPAQTPAQNPAQTPVEAPVQTPISLSASTSPSPPVSISASASAVQHEEDPARTARRREAYELLQRSRFEWQTMERHRMQDALQRLLRAVELDPDLAAARLELVRLCIAQQYYGFMPPRVAAVLVRETVPSPENIPGGADSYLPALGWVSFHVDRNLPAALWAFRQAERLPYNTWAMRTLTLLALGRHRFPEAIASLESAIRVDPWAAWPHSRLAWAHHLAGNAAASVQLVGQALERFPLNESVQLSAVTLLAFNGQTAQAVEIADKLERRVPSFDLATAGHAYALAMDGRPEPARALLERLEWLSRERYVLKTFSAAAYVALGEPEKALAQLRAANDARCPWFFQMLADPRLKPLHPEPEFQSMRGILAGMEAEAERDSIEE